MRVPYSPEVLVNGVSGWFRMCSINESLGFTIDLDVVLREQQILNDHLIDLNDLIQKINKGRGLVTPRYDRNYFHYECRTKSHKVYYPKLDKTTFTVPDDIFSIQVVDKIIASIDANLMD